MRVLVCGAREWEDSEFIYNYLYDLWRKHPDMEIVSGMCRGADSIAASFACDWGIRLFAFPADWKKYGKSAGAIRNRQMLREGNPTLVVAFHEDIDNSKGTKDMVELAYKEGLHVFVLDRGEVF